MNRGTFLIKQRNKVGLSQADIAKNDEYYLEDSLFKFNQSKLVLVYILEYNIK